MIKKEDYDLINRYIKGYLSDDEIEVFNKKLENDLLFTDAYHKQLLLIDIVNEAMDDEDIKRKIKNSIEKRKINSMAIRMMYPRLAAAVAAILLIVAGGLYLLKNNYIEQSDYKLAIDQRDSINKEMTVLKIEKEEIGKLLYDSNDVVKILISSRNLSDAGNLMGAGNKIDSIELKKPWQNEILLLSEVKNGVEFLWKSNNNGQAYLIVQNLNFDNLMVCNSKIEIDKQSHTVMINGFGAYQWFIKQGNNETEHHRFLIIPNSEK